MKRDRWARAAGLATLLCLASLAQAQTTRPGLWEIQHKAGGNAETDQAMARMQQQMAAMSPEQRKMMQDMMAKQGVRMPTPGSGGGMAVQVCITPEMAARSELPSQNEGDCTTTITSRSAGTMKMKYVCTKPPSSGEGTDTFSGDTAYTMQMVMNHTEGGKPRSMTMEGSGKWLAADCGAVKPITPPARK